MRYFNIALVLLLVLQVGFAVRNIVQGNGLILLVNIVGIAACSVGLYFNWARWNARRNGAS